MILCRMHIFYAVSLFSLQMLLMLHLAFHFLTSPHCLLLLLSTLWFHMILWTNSLLVLKSPHACVCIMPASLPLHGHLFCILFIKLNVLSWDLMSFLLWITLFSLPVILIHYTNLSVLNLPLCLLMSLSFLLPNIVPLLTIVLPQLIYDFMIFGILLLYGQQWGRDLWLILIELSLHAPILYHPIR